MAMELSEAYDELVESAASAGKKLELQRLREQLTPATDPTLIPPEIKAIIGYVITSDGTVEVSSDAVKAFSTGLGRIYLGKPADGVADKALDAELDSNIDLI